MRPTITHTRLRGPSGDATRARRRAANAISTHPFGGASDVR